MKTLRGLIANVREATRRDPVGAACGALVFFVFFPVSLWVGAYIAAAGIFGIFLWALWIFQP